MTDVITGRVINEPIRGRWKFSMTLKEVQEYLRSANIQLTKKGGVGWNLMLSGKCETVAEAQAELASLAQRHRPRHRGERRRMMPQTRRKQ